MATTTTQTTPALLAINHNGPIKVRYRGHGGNGTTKTYLADEHTNAVEMINAHGGPTMWEITAL